MTMYTNLVAGAIQAAIPALTSNRLLTLVPPIPVPRAGGWSTLREVVANDTVILAFLRHIARRPDARDRIRRYIVNPVVLGGRARHHARTQHGISGLGSISITPTVICNLHCDLCYNLTEIHHDPKEVLPVEVIDKVMTEGKAIGAYRYTFIGGEPLIRARDIITVARKHDDAMITIITNGLLLTEELARELADLGNIELSISIDGLEATHDASRGEGTFAKVLLAMERYRDAGGMLVFSPTVTSANYRELLSDAFIDLMIEKGCYMGYFHHYDLIGGQDRRHLQLDVAALRWMDARIAELVREKPVAIADQVLSRFFVDGCPAVRDFIHINHRGEAEACCMVPFAAGNVRDQSLVELMRSPYFSRVGATPSDAHGVRRCLVGENTAVLDQAVTHGEAFPTTKTSLDVLKPRVADDRLHPTCFSASIVEAPKRSRLHLPLLS